MSQPPIISGAGDEEQRMTLSFIQGAVFSMTPCVRPVEPIREAAPGSSDSSPEEQDVSQELEKLGHDICIPECAICRNQYFPYTEICTDEEAEAQVNELSKSGDRLLDRPTFRPRTKIAPPLHHQLQLPTTSSIR